MCPAWSILIKIILSHREDKSKCHVNYKIFSATIPRGCWGLSIFDKVRFSRVEKIGKRRFSGFLKNAIFHYSGILPYTSGSLSSIDEN